MRFVSSPYFSSRSTKNVELVVIHTTQGFFDSTIKYFQNNSDKVSSHYVVSADGSEVVQMVDEVNAAHHAGRVFNANEKYYKGFNPNWNSIGIENADNNQPSTWDRSGQYKTLAILVRDICKRWNIPIDRDHICGHKELYAKKSCPGNIDVDKVVQLAREADFTMDDDMKRAVDILQKSKTEFGFGNLEGTINGLVASQRDIVRIKADLQSYRDGEEIRIKTAVDTAITLNNKDWQSQLTSANNKIRELTAKIEALETKSIDKLSYSDLFSLAFKKLWATKKEE